VFKRLWLNVSADVGTSSYYSEIAMVQTLDNLRRDGTLDTIAYLERIPEKLVPRKQELIEALRNGAAGGAGEDKPDGGGGGAYAELGDQRFAALPGGMQGRFEALPGVAQRALLRQKGE